MWICYIDESGCTGKLPSATSQIQPVLVICGVIIKAASLHALTTDFLQIKRGYYPEIENIFPEHALDAVLYETKGNELRKAIRGGNRRKKRHTIGIFDRVIELLENYQIPIIGRVWIKNIGADIDGRAIYTTAIQKICNYFNHYLDRRNSRGIVIIDSRTDTQNMQVSHSIFTKMFKYGGNEYPNIYEMPTFGNSRNHVGLQISDIVCSGFIFPMATYSYCSGYIQSSHVSPRYSYIKKRYATRLEALQYRYPDCNGKWRGGITTSDGLSQRPGSTLFR